ncbi:related to erv25-component of the copii-coated vesicles [Ceraceosorus bombacis]|uniref:Related to erv25-component of the copii-coated vesicles n=1 Tax=Ceraceosorus bombacis TaxID=401625 RepID=A0A0P1BQK7_9BASI|nr:related to erv25-component of the copii-coated vesicles [Ceraceosorus bombacis]
MLTRCMLLLIVCVQLVSAIKFDLTAEHSPPVKCIWNYALSDTLVIVTINTKPNDVGSEADQRVDVEVVDGSKHNNVYLSKKGIGKKETRMAINTHTHADLGVCFKNTLRKGASAHPIKSTMIDLDVDIGADAVDYNAIANQESLSGLETEMRKLEAVAGEIVNEMDYLKKREGKMRDTNESTNNRVENFAWITIVALIGLGSWQIIYLRSFFKRLYLID